MRRKYGDGLSRLNEERVFRAEALELADDCVEALPVPCGAADSAVDDKILWPLGDVWIEVVHETAQGSFLLPAFAAKLRAARRANDWR
jgi:hypothetical protein